MDSTYVNGFSRADYSMVMLFTFSVGTVLIIAVTIDTVSKIITFRQIMRVIK